MEDETKMRRRFISDAECSWMEKGKKRVIYSHAIYSYSTYTRTYKRIRGEAMKKNITTYYIKDEKLKSDETIRVCI